MASFPQPFKKKKDDLPHDTNDSLDRIIESNDEANNPVVQSTPKEEEKKFKGPWHRQKNETVQQYNARVPIGLQPVQPPSEFDYLGRKRV